MDTPGTDITSSLVQTKIKAYNNYFQSVLGLSDEEDKTEMESLILHRKTFLSD